MVNNNSLSITLNNGHLLSGDGHILDEGDQTKRGYKCSVLY